MSGLQQTPAACAHCGAYGSTSNLYCPACGKAFIPLVEHPDTARERAAETTRSSPGWGPPTAQPEWGQPGWAQPVPSAGEPVPYPGYAPAPPPAESRNWAMSAHLSALIGALLGGFPAFVGPLVIWLLRRDRGDVFATEHARSALNFHISLLVYAIAAIVLAVVTLGLALIVLLPVALIAFFGYFVVGILAAVAASQGRSFRYPFAIPFV